MFFFVSVLLSPPYTSTPQNMRMLFNEFVATLVMVAICVYRLELSENLTLLYVAGWLVLVSMLLAVGVLVHTIFRISERITHRNLAMTEEIDQTDKVMHKADSIPSFDSNIKITG